MADNLRQRVLSTANMILDAVSRLEAEEDIVANNRQEGSGFSDSVSRSNTLTTTRGSLPQSNSGAGSSSSSSISGSSLTLGSQPLGANVHSEMSQLFSWNRHSSRHAHGKSSNSKRKAGVPAVSVSKKKKLKTWTHTFVCLAETTHMYIPDMSERTALKLAGLGEKKFSVFAYAAGCELQLELVREFPKLAGAGGYELLRAHESGGRELILIDIPHDGYSVEYLQAVIKSGKIYIRPLQRSLDMTPLLKEVGSPLLYMYPYYH